MTQSVTTTTQAEIRTITEAQIKTPADMAKDLRIKVNGYDKTLGFEDRREILIRGITLRVQATERPNQVKNLKAEVERYKAELARRNG